MQIVLAWFSEVHPETLQPGVAEQFPSRFPGILEVNRDQQKRAGLSFLRQLENDITLLSHPETEPATLSDHDWE
jgi:hypothetical protein